MAQQCSLFIYHTESNKALQLQKFARLANDRQIPDLHKSAWFCTLCWLWIRHWAIIRNWFMWPTEKSNKKITKITKRRQHNKLLLITAATKGVNCRISYSNLWAAIIHAKCFGHPMTMVSIVGWVHPAMWNDSKSMHRRLISFSSFFLISYCHILWTQLFDFFRKYMLRNPLH